MRQLNAVSREEIMETSTLIMQMMVSGLAMGMIYVLVASGFALMVGTAKLYNFMHGDLYMIGAYITYLITVQYLGAQYSLGLRYLLGLIGAAVALFILGGILFKVMFQYVRGDFIRCVIATMGLGVVLRQVVLILTGPYEKGMAKILPSSVTVGGIMISQAKLLVIALSVFVMLGVYFLLMKTTAGKLMRAVAIDKEAASLCGINTNRVYLITVCIACCLGGVAGGIIAPVFFLNVHMGANLLLIVFMVLVLGGMQSVIGALIAGTVVGLAESFGYGFFGSLIEVIIFCAIGIFLIFRPGGLMGYVEEHI
jgi:branched-chain amino acid transport system permease protein